jgi:hypothetical protein
VLDSKNFREKETRYKLVHILASLGTQTANGVVVSLLTSAISFTMRFCMFGGIFDYNVQKGEKNVTEV